MPQSSSTNAQRQTFEVEVFFDGDCPLCKREIALLQRWDEQSRIRFSDIAAPEFDATEVGVSHERLMSEIHGRLPDGRLITGVEVFRRLYGAVGFGWLVTVTRLPGVSQLLDVSYRFFARHRLRLTGRCEAAGCKVKPVRPEAVHEG